MNHEKINKITLRKRILIAPLDWGLGHATRCIPLIQLLIKHHVEVLIAADGPIALLLQKELPNIVILPLKGYNIRYSSRPGFFSLKMLAQAPGIFQSIRYEHKWLDKIIPEYKIDAVISDNRFGFFSKKIPCVFITHQLFINTGYHFLNRLVQKINYSYINKFNECWVPDVADAQNLAGGLSHPAILPRTPVTYLGLLSRCKKKEYPKNIDLLILLSGPEPQRSIFENILLKQLKHVSGTVIMLRGLPAAADLPLSGSKNISIHNHLPSAEINELIQRSNMVVARSGYSSIMDLAAVKQKAILVPTPGQKEQEYLAFYLKGRKMFFTAPQENFSISKALEEAGDFDFSNDTLPALHEDIILKWIQKNGFIDE